MACYRVNFYTDMTLETFVLFRGFTDSLEHTVRSELSVNSGFHGCFSNTRLTLGCGVVLAPCSTFCVIVNGGIFLNTAPSEFLISGVFPPTYTEAQVLSVWSGPVT